jgi:hypothetical protein
MSEPVNVKELLDRVDALDSKVTRLEDNTTLLARQMAYLVTQLINHVKTPVDPQSFCTRIRDIKDELARRF